MFCKHCGQQIDDDSTFCSKCGQPVGNGAPARGNDSGLIRNISPNAPVQKSNVNAYEAVKKIIYVILGIGCLVMIPLAEYRRIVGGHFDVMYWVMCAPSLISIYCLYKLISAGSLADEQERIRKAKERGEVYEDKLSKIKTDTLALCCIIIAIVAFASSGIINAIF